MAKTLHIKLAIRISNLYFLSKVWGTLHPWGPARGFDYDLIRNLITDLRACDVALYGMNDKET